MANLLDDIELAIHQADKYKNFKYRVGTIILHNDDATLHIVDGQQRIIILTLIYKVLDRSIKPPILQLVKHSGLTDTIRS